MSKKLALLLFIPCLFLLSSTKVTHAIVGEPCAANGSCPGSELCDEALGTTCQDPALDCNINENLCVNGAQCNNETGICSPAPTGICNPACTGGNVCTNGVCQIPPPVGNPSPVNIGFTIPNPIKANSLACLLYYIVNGVIDLLAVLAALYIIYSGFLFVAAQGNETKLKQAKTAFFNAIIGTAILLAAWGITQFVVNTVNQVLTPTNVINASPNPSACP